MENNEELLNKIQDLDKRISDVESSKNEQSQEVSQLEFPLDPQSRKILEDVIDARTFVSVWESFFTFSTYFESTEGLSLTGSTTTCDGGGLTLGTAASNTTSATASKYTTLASPLDFSKEQRFRAKILFYNLTKMTANIGAGLYHDDYPFYGFYINGTSLYGLSKNNTSTESKVLLQTIAADTFYRLEAKLYPGQKITFYVDGIEKGSIVTNLPIDTASYLYIFSARISTEEDVAKAFYLSAFDYIQKKL